MSQNDYGIRISEPGVSVVNARPDQITFNSANAMIKIDTQNKAGFQTFTILITNNPTNPPGGGGTAYTQIYKFKHGYTYIPSLETLIYLSTPPPTTASYQTYFQDSGSLGQITPFDSNTFYAMADATYVYFYIAKFNSGAGTNALLTGTNLLVTTHVFVEGVLDS